MRRRKRSKIAVSVSSVGTSFDAPKHESSGHAQDLPAARVAPLVQEREERVQDGRVALEDLVEEDDLRVRQHPLDAPLVAPLAERGDVDRAEDLVRLGEAREEVLEVAGVDQPRERADERALRRPGGPDEDGVLAGDDRDEEEADDLVLAEEPLGQGVRDLRQAGREGLARRVRAKLGSVCT